MDGRPIPRYSEDMPETFDVLIIGGGISGVSLAARLAEGAKVAVVEGEAQLGVHATGRSAALLVEAYGPPAIRVLTRISRSFFEQPPDGFCDAPLARRRGGLIYAGADDVPRLEQEYQLAACSTPVDWLDAEAALDVCPILRRGVAAAGFLEPGALDLDTNALLSGFARVARRHGAAILSGAAVSRIERSRGGWRVMAGATEITCRVLVDAAGAWADRLAEMAGVAPCGLQPMRRTAATLAAPAEIEATLGALPFAAPVDESFYFKPEARSIMVSLSDETPSDPCDAYPDDLDVAIALDRFHGATTIPEARPIATWAGLRTFAPDRNPVVGFDAGAPDFFWYAGQGGYGIQTSPALSALAAKLILGEAADAVETEIAARLHPGRLRADPT